MQPQVVLLRFSTKQTKVLIIGANVSKNLISDDVFNLCITYFDVAVIKVLWPKAT